MFGRKCSLCGGRLNQNHICMECGLDNTKSDANYRMNQNTADYGKLTHTHRLGKNHGWEEKTVQKQGRDIRQQEQISEWDREARWSQSAKAVKRKRRTARITAVTAIVLLFAGMMPGVLSLVSERFRDNSPEGQETGIEEYEYDPYEYLTKEFREGGEAYSTVLEAGEYIVGVHIPEGRYTVKRREDYGSIQVRDELNNLYMSYFLGGEDSGEREDIRLFLGARVSLDIEMEFVSENAQVSLMTSRENPLTESILLDVEYLRAGESFEPGVYDFVIDSGFGSAAVEIKDEQGASLDSIIIWMDTENKQRKAYRNVVLPEGAEISCMEEEMQITMIPSGTIVNTDYLSYYTWDYLEQEPFRGLLEENEE